MLFFKVHIRLLFTVLVNGTFYLLNLSFFRPYIYSCCDSSLIAIVVGILPNFIGTFLFASLIRYFSNYTFFKVFLISMALPLFMEFQRNITAGHNFDIYDIVASLISMVFVYFFVGNNRFIKPIK